MIGVMTPQHHTNEGGGGGGGGGWLGVGQTEKKALAWLMF